MSYLDIYKAGIFAYSAANFVTVMPEHVKIDRNYRFRKKNAHRVGNICVRFAAWWDKRYFKFHNNC